MNNYKAQSQKYQIFVCSEMINVNINKIYIPKLNLHLEYDNECELYKLIKLKYKRLTKDSILNSIKHRIKKNLKPLWYEINHFTIEDNLIVLIKSKDELNQRLASEILLLKLNRIKL